MLTPRLQQCLAGGMTILLGTVDAEGYPACARGAAIKAAEDLSTVTVYVSVQTGQETIANIATTRRIAISLSNPHDNASVQLKGTTSAVRLARADEAQLVRDSIEKYSQVLEPIGLPKRLTRSFAHWPAFAIDVQIQEVFDQTPGPNAGAAVPIA